MEKGLEKVLDKAKSNRNKALLLTLAFPEESLEQLIAFQRAHLKKAKRVSNNRNEGGELKQNIRQGKRGALQTWKDKSIIRSSLTGLLNGPERRNDHERTN